MQRRLLASLFMTALVVPLSGAAATAQSFDDTLEPVVIDPGAEPRQLLRYEFSEGDTMASRFTLDMAISMDMNGAAMMDMRLPMTMQVDMTVVDVRDDGSARVEFEFTELEFGEISAEAGLLFGSGDLSELEQGLDSASGMMDEVTDMLVGITGWQIIDDRGNVLDVGFEEMPGLPADLAGQFDQAATPTEPLPAEPVGLGARWTSSGVFDSGGLPLDIEMTTTVVELDEDGVVLERTIAMDASALEDMLGDLPAGVDVNVDAFEIDGGGSMDVDFASIVPDGDLMMDMRMAMSAGSDDDELPLLFDIGMDMQMSMQFERIES